MSVSLDNIVDVTIEINNPSVISSNFNLGLIIGDSTVLTAENRVKVYPRASYAKDMVTDGFTTTSPEYLAAVAYFSQSPASSQIAIGVKLESETNIVALQNCRNFNGDWYGCAFAAETTDSDIPAIATAVDSFAEPTKFFFVTKDPQCLSTGTTNVLNNIKNASVKNTIGIYYTEAPNFVSAVLGLFSGFNSMDVDSAYTMAYKSIVGFIPESLTDSQLNAIVSYNGNAYAEFGRRYNFFYPGVTASGTHIDEAFFLDAAKYLVQQYAVSGLVAKRVVPQTESGVNEIVSYISEGCDVLASMGFIATGIWDMDDVLALKKGDAVPGGYLIQAGSLADQSASDRKARKSPPIYVCLKGAGAIEHVVVRIYVNR